jgi:hypothetical protein
MSLGADQVQQARIDDMRLRTPWSQGGLEGRLGNIFEQALEERLERDVRIRLRELVLPEGHSERRGHEL